MQLEIEWTLAFLCFLWLLEIEMDLERGISFSFFLFYKGLQWV